MPSSSINPFDSSELIPPSQNRGLSQTGSQMNVSRYSTFGTIIRIGGRNLEKSSVLSEKSSNSATSSKSGKQAQKADVICAYCLFYTQFVLV